MVNITTTKAEDLRAEREKEYGTYRAREEIFIDGVLAFGIGFQVPVSHTEEYPELLQAGEDGKAPVVTVEEYEAEQEQKAADEEAAAVATPPPANAPRSAWVKYATAQGASGDETQAVKNGGLSRDELADKYGA
jgi:hypothetical protein